MTVSVPELLSHAELHASVWTDVMIALRRLGQAAEFVTIKAGDKPIFAGDVLSRATSCVRSPVKLTGAALAPRAKRLPTVAVMKKAKPAAPKKPAAPAVDRKKRDLLDWAAREQTVVVVLRSAKGPLKTAEVAAKARLSDHATKQTLRRLVKAGRAVHTGATSTSRWLPLPVPSTGVTRPSPPVPAHGTATSPATITVSGQQFERAWDGKAGLTSVGRS